jgi:mannose-6-phosphate isomerase-like protein (cupin superfamily)
VPVARKIGCCVAVTAWQVAMGGNAGLALRWRPTGSEEQVRAKYETTRLNQAAEQRAPDGSRVRPLLSLEAGSMAQFELDPGEVSHAVRHRTVSEIWLVLSGTGQIWRQLGEEQSVAALEPGVCVSIPVGTAFQFRCSGDQVLRIAGITMPPWPGDEEAVLVSGEW